MSLLYPIGTSGQQVIFGDNVLSHFSQHRQHRFWHAEAGGQLFATFKGHIISIDAVTGPKITDYRTRYSYAACRRDAQADIDALHRLGFHYVGEWHTHPQRIPNPSWRDKITMASRVRRSRHDMRGLIFVIVGSASFPKGLKVMLHDGNDVHSLDLTA
jgi:integrative and conjugative element protein (TIGR02256 family)